MISIQNCNTTSPAKLSELELEITLYETFEDHFHGCLRLEMTEISEFLAGDALSTVNVQTIINKTTNDPELILNVSMFNSEHIQHLQQRLNSMVPDETELHAMEHAIRLNFDDLLK
ncbi:hypothetical protein HK096_006767 [Nowakowskiella sp. JEL0078]|nr:hypothetical protein HK096_006767 [Nowakowskiella sp. JEL0078]